MMNFVIFLEIHHANFGNYFCYLILNGICINFFQMKKYQLWLERKSYSQHLSNLIKIQHSRVPSDKSVLHQTMNIESASPSRYRQFQQFRQHAQQMGDITYAITYKQLNNRKLRLMKSFEILNENMSMVRRIKEAKSVVNNKKLQIGSDFDIRKKFEKKCQVSHLQLRNKSFKKFQQWQNNKIQNYQQKYQLVVQVLNFPKAMQGKQRQISLWCEVSTYRLGAVRSQIVSVDLLKEFSFSFFFDKSLPSHLAFKICRCKSLQSEDVGVFSLLRPKLGQAFQGWFSDQTGRTQIQLKLNYSQIQRDKPFLTLK